MGKCKSSKIGSPHHSPMFHGLEMALLSPLIQSTDFNYDIVSECENRGFITASVMEALSVAKFLSRTVLAAQKAQRIYGVPASFLISMGLYKSGWDVDSLIEDIQSDPEWLGCDCCYSPGILKWFMETAKSLAESPVYREALLLSPDVKAYAEKLFSLGFRYSIDMEDILSPIDRYDLNECDLAALRCAGEYTKEQFTKYQDEDGSIRLRLSWLDCIPMLQTKAQQLATEASV